MNNTQSPNSDANKMTEEQGSQLMQLRARFDSSKERERVATTARCACMCLTGRMDSPETNQGSDALIRNQQGDIYNLNWSHTRVAVNQKEYSQSISLS